MVGTGAVSVQFGGALATKLFGRVGPAGAVTLRLVLAAMVLLAFMGIHGRGRASVASARRSSADWSVAVAFGVVLAAMNLSFYEAIQRVPLGVAVTVEFSGPLAVALFGSRRWTDALWAAAAGVGVALLAVGAGHHLDLAGVGLALLAGSFWVGYIMLSKETGRRFTSFTGLAWAMSVAGLLVLPFGVAQGGSHLWRPSVLALGLVVALLSSVVPYSLELLALRGVTPRAFGVMLSLDPALATAAGFAVLGQHLTLVEWAALSLVVVANLGNTLSSRRPPLPQDVMAGP